MWVPFCYPFFRCLKLRASGTFFSYTVLFFFYILRYYGRKAKGEKGMDIEKVLCIIGIIMCTIGTVLSLWTILTTKIKRVGTWEQLGNAQESFKKEKTLVVIGCLFIIMGSILQIIGTLI